MNCSLYQFSCLHRATPDTEYRPTHCYWIGTHTTHMPIPSTLVQHSWSLCCRCCFYSLATCSTTAIRQMAPQFYSVCLPWQPNMCGLGTAYERAGGSSLTGNFTNLVNWLMEWTQWARYLKSIISKYNVGVYEAPPIPLPLPFIASVSYRCGCRMV